MNKSGKTKLHDAIIDGLNELAYELILSGKVDVNAQDEQGYTPLHAAAKLSRVKIVELLLSHGANLSLLDAWGNTALWRALGPSDENKKIVQLLLSHGAEPDKKNFSGVSVLDHVRKIKTHSNRYLFEKYL